ncbi:MAG: hypothetical protein OEZ22_06225, partial [Spirochaetia bacterium]|nr:hypothetical protein [Spirochaetia bacterium]
MKHLYIIKLKRFKLAIVLSLTFVSYCSKQYTPPTSIYTNIYSIGGTVTGLSSGTLIIKNNETDILNITANGEFLFDELLPGDALYNVTIVSNPEGQYCTITNGSGIIASSNITNIEIICQSGYYVGGTVNGITSGNLVLQNNGGDNIEISSDGPFSFPIIMAADTAYTVSIFQNPTGHLCSITNAAGTIGASDITNITVNCISTWTVWVDVTGITSGSLTLQNNAGDDIPVSADASYSFATMLSDGATYNVTTTNPTGHLCTVTGGVGTIALSDVTVTVNCIS